MPIVTNFNSLFTPNVFLKEQEPAATIRGGGIGTVGVILQSIRGEVNVSTLVSDLSDFVRKFGGYDATLPEGYMFVYNLFKQGASAIKVVRVTDGNESAASGVSDGSTFVLTTPGTWGNDVTLEVSASSVTGYVDLLFTYGSEQYNYRQITFTDSADDNYIDTILNNASENFVTLEVNGGSNPSVGTVTFSGGSNGTDTGSSLNDTAYVGTSDTNGLTGLVTLEADTEINFVCSPRASSTVNDALVTHVGLAGVSPRMAIIAPAQGTQIADLVTTMATINSDNVIMTYPWLQIVNPTTGVKEYHTPTAFYAGLLSTLSYEQSPSRKQLLGIIATERALRPAEVDQLSQNRVSPITLLAGMGFVVRNGYNTSSVPAKANITRSRARNFFALAFENGAQQFVSKPHTVQLRNDIRSSFGALCQTEYSLGKIGNVNGGPAYNIQCDAANNPVESVRQNKLIVDVQISLLAPADFILITMDASEAKVISAN